MNDAPKGEAELNAASKPESGSSETNEHSNNSNSSNNENDDLQELYGEISKRKERIAVLGKIFAAISTSVSERAKKRPDDIINTYKARKINAILEEMRAGYQSSGYEDLLELIEEPQETEQDGRKTITGMTYSDADVLLKHYAMVYTFVKYRDQEK